jgi:2-polyprenyl-3-methyl-5-hydroxy-6-metoxy-1,4-benzoquinol methylase
MSYGKLLDIGCGLDFFLDAIKPFCNEVYGEEISEFEARFVRKRLGINVFQGALTDLNLPAEYFDTITMWELLEHVSDPASYLKEVHRILRKGGLVAISTPNFNGFTSKIAKEKWLVINPPEHLFYFTPHTLKKMLEKTGFIIIEIKTYDWDVYNIYKSLRSRSIMDRKKAWKERGMFYSSFQSKTAVAYLYKGLDMFIRGLNAEDHLEAYAIKI